MSLKANLASLDEVHESLHSLYTERDGKFVLGLAPEEIEALAGTQIAGLKQNAAAALAEKKAAQEELAKFRAAGLKPDDIAALKEEREKIARQKALDEGRYNELLKETNDKHAQELATRTQREADLMRALEEKHLHADAVAAITAAQGIPELLLPHVRSRLRMIEEGNGPGREFQVRVVDDKGNPRYKDSVGNFMTVSDLVAEFKANDIFARNFHASGAGGSGGPPSTNGAGAGKKSVTRAAFTALGPVAQMDFVKTGGVVTD